MKDSSYGWYLRRATYDDLEAVHALCCIPEVYRYLYDNEPPSLDDSKQWIDLNYNDELLPGMGVWLLFNSEEKLAGGVSLWNYERPAAAEIIYLLHPQFWGQGLATRMSWAVMSHAFELGHIEEIIAGADDPNASSVEVMKRLGMRYHRSVEYRMGAGTEYVMKKADRVPINNVERIPLRD